MTRERTSCIARLLVATLAIATPSAGIAATIVVPPGMENLEGSSSASNQAFPAAGIHVQEVHPAEHFASLGSAPFSIVGMAVRPDRVIGRQRSRRWNDAVIKFSTSSAAPGSLSSRFDANVGEDETTVLTGDLLYETDGNRPSDGPHDFDYRFEFERPFFYDPSQGNLLMDVSVGSRSQIEFRDAHSPEPRLDRTILGLSANASQACCAFDLVSVIEFMIEPSLQAGDADQDQDFDQFDLIQVQQSSKYLTGLAATWGEGDWNGAPGGMRGSPPAGNAMFDQKDIIAALTAGVYLRGPYAAIAPNGVTGDGQTSVVYDASSGEIAVDAPAGAELTSINIDSASGMFIGESALNLGGSFDNDSNSNIFKATFGGSFGSISFGNVAESGLSADFILDDLTVVGSLAGGGDLGAVDLIYVPEPTSAVLLAAGFLIALSHRRKRCGSPPRYP